MKALCSIIRDILPLYYDNVCSKESRVMVDEHLKECAECRDVLSALGDEMTHHADIEDEAKPIKIIKEGIEKRKRRSVLKGVIIAVLVCTVVAGVCFWFTQRWNLWNLSADYIQVYDVSVLSDGRIVFRYALDNKVQSLMYIGKNDSETLYMIPQGYIFGDRQGPVAGVYGDIFGRLDVYAEYAVFDAEDVTAFYVGTENKAQMIWEQGMELPPASAELELFLRINDPLLDRTDAGYSEDGYTVPAVKDHFINLTLDGALTVSADELSEYQLYTNSERIRITIPKGNYESVFELYDVENESDFTMVMELDQRNRTGTFEHLTAAKNYYIVAYSNNSDVLIIVTD